VDDGLLRQPDRPPAQVEGRPRGWRGLVGYALPEPKAWCLAGWKPPISVRTDGSRFGQDHDLLDPGQVDRLCAPVDIEREPVLPKGLDDRATLGCPRGRAVEVGYAYRYIDLMACTRHAQPSAREAMGARPHRPGQAIGWGHLVWTQPRWLLNAGALWSSA
jgi:hypothetical protein